MILTVLLLHLVLGIALIAAGDRAGTRAFALAAIAPAVTLAWLATEIGAVLDGRPTQQRVEWIPQLDLAIDLRLDAMGAVMVALVSGIGLLVCIYALGYFSHPKPGTGRLAGLLTVFAGSMLGVVLSDHLLALFVFWELTSITSYLLIGNDDRNPRARDAALSAILITGAGGLAMLVGFVLIGQAAGTYRLSELVVNAPGGATMTAGVVLVLIGAFTKSAQLPFAGWLPGAMVAPTPISAYLHAATMVKAGVYLVARLAPLLADIGPWRPIVLVVSSATMIVGGWRALRQHDLKLLLAYGTVSQLAFMMLLFGMGRYDLAQAGIVVLIAHGAFKASLFMVVGVIDHQTGTRDVRKLHGFSRAWWPVTAATVLAAASMAGFPPLLGFIAKEKGLDAALHADFGGGTALVVVLVIGSILTVGYSGRFVLGVLGKLGDPDLDAESRTAAAPAIWFAAPAVLLAVASLVAGVAPVLVDKAVRSATTTLYQGATPKHVVLWAGFNTALLLSIVIIGSGLLLIAMHDRAERLQRAFATRIAWIPDSDRVFWAIVTGTSRFARKTTRTIQNGSLPVYLMIILGVAAALPLGPALRSFDAWPDLIGDWVHVPIAVVIVVAAVGATVVRRRIASALMLGAVGFAMAGFYVAQGDPDLALTQFTIETLATVLFVLVLRFLPRRFDDVRAAVTAPIRFAVAGLVGVTVFVLALVASGARSDVSQPSISDEMLERSVPDGKGANVVNVILVDFRGLDTLGEITVLVVAALGAVSLARVARRPGDTQGNRRGFAELPIVDASARLLYPSILVLSAYFLFAGHNQPGGGFVGGLTAGAAISLRYLAGGVSAVRNSFRIAPWTVLGSGLAISALTALVPLFSGNSLLEHAALEWDAPLLGTMKTTSALPFDIGVYLVVVGLVLMAYEAFGDDAAPAPLDTAPDADADDRIVQVTP
jgi:multicomponent Na+:H+ antiporter subunit A